jgi:hypothetical protein
MASHANVLLWVRSSPSAEAAPPPMFAARHKRTFRAMPRAFRARPSFSITGYSWMVATSDSAARMLTTRRASSSQS